MDASRFGRCVLQKMQLSACVVYVCMNVHTICTDTHKVQLYSRMPSSPRHYCDMPYDCFPTQSAGARKACKFHLHRGGGVVGAIFDPKCHPNKLEIYAI